MEPKVGFDLESIRKIETVYSHASCYDGTAAAIICAFAFKRLGIDPKFEFIQYDSSEQLNLIPKPNCLFIDITPSLLSIDQWLPFKPLILDHHETAKPAVESLQGIFGLNSRFESGANLAYNFIYKPIEFQYGGSDECDECDGSGTYKLDGEICKCICSEEQEVDPISRFAHLCAIRDTWQDKHEDWEAAQYVCHGLDLYSNQELLEKIQDGSYGPNDLVVLSDIGSRLYRKILRKSKAVAQTAFITTINYQQQAIKVAIFNCTEKIISETCHILLNEYGCQLAISYFTNFNYNEFQTVVSLRSNTLKVNEIAQRFGGGGHQGAAGYRIKSLPESAIPTFILKSISD